MIDLQQFGSPPLTQLLSESLRDKLQDLGRKVQFSDGQLIHQRGGATPGLSLVVSGAVHIGIVGSDGSFITTSIFGPGQCFGEFTLFAGLPRTHDASAVGETIVNQIPAKPFMALFDSEPALSRALLTVTLVRCHGLLEFMDDNRRLPRIVHLAKYLLGMSETAQQPDLLHCRQQDLAFLFGVSRVSIGKMLKQLEREARIELGYGYIRLLDADDLRLWVAEQSPIEALRARPAMAINPDV